MVAAIPIFSASWRIEILFFVKRNLIFEEGNITVDDIAKSVGEDVVIIKEKLCGKEDFIINEAMTINMELFPDIPFKTLFSHYKND